MIYIDLPMNNWCFPWLSYQKVKRCFIFCHTQVLLKSNDIQKVVSKYVGLMIEVILKPPEASIPLLSRPGGFSIYGGLVDPQ